MSIFGRGKNKREGRISTGVGTGEHIVKVPFNASTVEAHFDKHHPGHPHASCQHDPADSVSIDIIDSHWRRSTIKITWTTYAKRHIVYTIVE